MGENKTKPTAASVDDYLGAIASEEQRKDCIALVKLLRRVTGQKPRMWGPSIVGFGSYHYRYASGREGDACLTGLSARGKEVVVYVMPGAKGEDALLAALGKHRRGKACLYLKRLSDVDADVLERVVANSVAHLRAQYPA